MCLFVYIEGERRAYETHSPERVSLSLTCRGAHAQDLLWQVQLAGDKAAFTYMIMAITKDALLEHPDDRVRSIQALETVLNVRVVLGGPANEGASDPDQVGLVDWQVAIYSNGLDAALAFIDFVMGYKVRQGLLPAMPELLVHLVDNLRGAILPAPWSQLADTTVPMPKLFSALPPRGRRHVLAQLEVEQEGPNQQGEPSSSRESDPMTPNQAGQDMVEGARYILSFYGNLYPFKDRFEANGIPGAYTAINGEGRPDYVRYVRFKMEAGLMEVVLLVLEKVLMNMPVYFVNMAGEKDDAAGWLEQQRSIIPAESCVPATCEG